MFFSNNSSNNSINNNNKCSNLWKAIVTLIKDVAAVENKWKGVGFDDVASSRGHCLWGCYLCLGHL